MTSSTTIDTRIVAMLRQSDKTAISLLYDNYSDALFGVILRIVQQEHLAEEILQDTFLKIWKFRESYDETKGRFFTWMLNIARNTAIDQTRLKSFSQKNQDIDNVVSIIDSKEQDNFNVDGLGLREIIAELPEEHRSIINLVYFQGYTHIEAAETLNIPLGTLKTRLRLAIVQLRKTFGLSMGMLGYAFGFYLY
jgi:RNA polymerase sigma-70 factor (ECF subfamily)